MAPKIKVTKEDIIEKSVEIIKKEGCSALNARRIAEYIGCSTQPVFSNFKSMNELKEVLIKKAEEIYTEYRKAEISKNYYPPYKASGVSYINFAREQRELFIFLYMRDRRDEDTSNAFESIDDLIPIIQKSTGLSKDDALLFHLEMWIYVHGIATMIATDYLDLNTATASSMITDVYQGLVLKFKEKEKEKCTQ